MPSVFWLIAAQRSLLKAFMSDPQVPEPRYREVYLRLCQILAETFPQAQSVVVCQRLHGYRNRAEKHVLLVEVFGKSLTLFGAPLPQSTDDSDTDRIGQPDFLEAGEDCRCRGTNTTGHIVKCLTLLSDDAGQQDEELRQIEAKTLENELDAWEKVRPIGMTHHSLLMMLRCGARDEAGRLKSILYEDAHHVLGGQTISPFQDAVLDCVRWGVPKLETLRYVIRCLFEHLGTDLYARSYVLPTPEQNHARIQTDLTRFLEDWRDELPDEPAADSEAFSGGQPERYRARRDVDGFMIDQQAGFLDPADYLESILQCPHFTPLLLRGTAHGDLHGLNILLSRSDDDAIWPGIFDYEDMGTDKLIGWDFVKLETELKVRALAIIVEGDEAHYMHAVYEFEHHVAEWTHAKHDGQSFSEKLPAKQQALYRLARLVMEIRVAAMEHMGRRRHRDRQWLEGYYFLLAMYALQAARFETYQRRHVIAAWISGGVAARLLSRPRYQFNGLVRSYQKDAAKKLADKNFDPAAFALESKSDDMGHHGPFAFAYAWSRAAKPENQPYQEAALRILESLRQRFPHILEIEEELTLLYLELGRRSAAETLMEQVSQRYNLSMEMLCRMGRSFKDQGIAGENSGQDEKSLFLLALAKYRKAYEQSGHYYPGLNVATVLLLLDRPNESREMAATILERLSQTHANERELGWHHAAKGEALLLLDRFDESAIAYKHARDVLPLRDRQSARRQAEWILQRKERATGSSIWPENLWPEIFGPDTRPGR